MFPVILREQLHYLQYSHKLHIPQANQPTSICQTSLLNDVNDFLPLSGDSKIVIHLAAAPGRYLVSG
jgi:hypothetical protein